MRFRTVAALDALWSGEMLPCTVGGRKVVLVRIGDDVSAFEDRCAHLGVALSEGTLEGGVLTCSAHRYEYDASSGAGINPRTVCLTRFPVRIEGGEVLVDVDEPVGPVLEAGENANAVVEAIRRLNRSVAVQDRGSYLRVLVPGRCVVTRAAIESILGRPFRLPGDLELLMPSFKGMFRVSEDEAEWSFDPT
jgi:toluene monooxygenase system ferredoxin subunit